MGWEGGKNTAPKLDNLRQRDKAAKEGKFKENDLEKKEPHPKGKEERNQLERTRRLVLSQSIKEEGIEDQKTQREKC